MRDALPHFAELRTGGLVRHAQRAPVLPRLAAALVGFAAVAVLISL